MTIKRKFLEINLTNHQHREIMVPDDEFKEYLGGSGIAIKYLYDILNPSVSPLHPENPLLLIPGLLTGTLIPTASKTSVCGRSPLTGIWNEATVGGKWGAMLKKNGWEGIIIKGKANKPEYLYINSQKIEFQNAEHIWGLDTYDTSELIKNIYPQVQIASIGQAGENLIPMAAIVFDAPHYRLAGRGGLGAVMGSKNLKAIAVQISQQSIPISNQIALKNNLRELNPLIKKFTRVLHDYGTGGSVEARELTGDLPIKNFAQSRWSAAGKTTGQVIADTIFKKHYACYACPISCGKEVFFNKKVVHGPEYETLSAFGSLLLNEDLDSIVMMNDLCNRYGIDTISLGVAIAFAIEASEKNILKNENLFGIDLTWGKPEAYIAIINQIASNTHLGKLIGQGVKYMSELLGDESKEYAIHTKGLEYPMHDPRAYTGMALSYATANRGACHLESLSYMVESGLPMKELGYDEKNKIDPHTSTQKAELVVKLQNFMNVFNALGLCKFLLAGRVGPETVADWVNMVTGWNLSKEELLKIGERLHNLKRMYNIKLGISRKDDTIPPRLLELARNDGLAAGVLPDLDHMLTEYYQIRQWDQQGIPTKDKLLELKLE